MRTVTTRIEHSRSETWMSPNRTLRRRNKPTEPLNHREFFANPPALFVVLATDANFPILDASDAYLRATMTERDEIVGRGLFEVFPDNPQEEHATSTRNLRASLWRV